MSMSHNLWLEYPIAAGVEAYRDEENTFGAIADSWVPVDNFINSSTVFNDSEVENALKDGHHPRIYIQSRGHGISMAPNHDICLNAGNRLGVDRWDQRGFPHSWERGDDFEGTGIVYYLGKGAGDSIRDPLNSNKLIDSEEGRQGGPADDHQNRWAKYQLAKIKELWKRRTSADQQQTYENDEHGLQAFHGLGNKAHPPWTMPASRVCPYDLDDMVSEPGEIFLDPLSAFPKHFNFEDAENATLRDDPLLTGEKYDVDPRVIHPIIIGNEEIPAWAVSIASAFILDSSGSMAWDNKIDCARLGVEGAIRALSSYDFASISHFSNTSNTPTGLEIISVSNLKGATNTDDKFSALSKISPGGGTCIGKGLLEGWNQLEESRPTST